MFNLNILTMSDANVYYFFRLDRFKNDYYPEFRIARNYDELVSKLGPDRAGSYYKITKLSQVSDEHLFAVFELLRALKHCDDDDEP